ncbi:MAG TPA: hypothetical protein VG841_06635 [Caulobacterales bacterium]|nr:hypothetical protein [Caulobacterales bacterium]
MHPNIRDKPGLQSTAPRIPRRESSYPFAVPAIALNTRETAAVIWLTVAAGAVAFGRSTRPALFDLLRAFASPHILTLLSIVAAYIAACVALLAKVHLWEADNLKTTIIWALIRASMPDVPGRAKALESLATARPFTVAVAGKLIELDERLFPFGEQTGCSKRITVQMQADA